ncbi:MAG: hypothetical protein J6F30_05650 [Cellulosilyticum sp.]|nr:hypothetical protein [Cellulosilyticum sp.]
MSNIIKSGRIRSQSFLDLSQRQLSEMIVRETYESDLSLNVNSKETDVTTELIHKRKEELYLLEEEIQRKREEANRKIEEILSEAYSKSDLLLNEAAEEKNKVLQEAHQRQAEIIQLAEDEANQIKSSAEKEKQALLESVEDEVVDTMITLLQHLISEELQHNVAWLKLVVRKMLLNDLTTESFKLLVSPHNMILIEQNQTSFKEGISKVTNIECDETLNDTTCILETSQGKIEYDVSQGLEKMITEIRMLKGIS